MKLNKFHIADAATCTPGHRNAIARGGIWVAGVAIHLTNTPRSQHNRLSLNRLYAIIFINIEGVYAIATIRLSTLRLGIQMAIGQPPDAPPVHHRYAEGHPPGGRHRPAADRLRAVADGRHGRSVVALCVGDGVDLSNFKEQLKASLPSDTEKLRDKIIGMNIFNAVFVDCTASKEIADLYQTFLEHNISVVAANKIAASDQYDKDISNSRRRL